MNIVDAEKRLSELREKARIAAENWAELSAEYVALEKIIAKAKEAGYEYSYIQRQNCKRVRSINKR